MKTTNVDKGFRFRILHSIVWTQIKNRELNPNEDRKMLIIRSLYRACLLALSEGKDRVSLADSLFLLIWAYDEGGAGFIDLIDHFSSVNSLPEPWELNPDHYLNQIGIVLDEILEGTPAVQETIEAAVSTGMALAISVNLSCAHFERFAVKMAEETPVVAA